MTLRVGVIGAGYWGPNLVRNLSEAPGAEPVAVADLSPERLEAIRKRVPPPKTTPDHPAPFPARAIDPLCLAPPGRPHPTLAARTFPPGKHLLLEKPHP